MDPDKKCISFSRNCDFIEKNKCFDDTTLRLNCFSPGGSIMDSFGRSRGNIGRKSSKFTDDGCRLVLGLGPTPSAYCDHDYLETGIVNENGSATTISHQCLLSESESVLKLGLSRGDGEAISTQTRADISCLSNQISNDNSKLLSQIVDEGSTSAKKSGGYMPSLLLAPRMKENTSFLQMQEFPDPGGYKLPYRPSQLCPEPSATTDFSIEAMSDPATMETSSDNKTNTTTTKICKYEDCDKGARGATGLCIGHGGGQRCHKLGCSKGAESRTAYCKGHGGGRRCQYLGCTKSAEGKTDNCIAHGGGRRCGHLSGCQKAARGNSGLCIRHGGGKRCKVENCTRSAEGQAGLCISHGGGRRCQYHECSKGAQGSTMYCKAHGGGKRCVFTGCMKGAEGSTPLCKGHGGGKRCLFDGGGICPKSVHGGTNFCVAHGGGKRCVVPDCTKSARGRTDCCVKHGGGKRCRKDHCGKSAQGSTDFCKAHGGGKRCSWNEGKCEKFARGKSGLCAAHTSLVQEREINKGGLIGPGLFHGLVSANNSSSGYSSSGVSALSDCLATSDKPAKRQQLIPPQVLVPLSMKCSPSEETEVRLKNTNWRKKFDFMVPEGRVHGGGLMSLLGGNLKNAFDGI